MVIKSEMLIHEQAHAMLCTTLLLDSSVQACGFSEEEKNKSQAHGHSETHGAATLFLICCIHAFCIVRSMRSTKSPLFRQSHLHQVTCFEDRFSPTPLGWFEAATLGHVPSQTQKEKECPPCGAGCSGSACLAQKAALCMLSL